MTSIANPNDTVRFAGSLWRIETRIGGVYQLRAFRADGLGLTDEVRLAQRHQFVVTKSGNAGSDAAPREQPALSKAFPKRPPYLTRKTAQRRETFAPCDAMSTDAQDYETGGAMRAQLQRALQAGVNIDGAD